MTPAGAFRHSITTDGNGRFELDRVAAPSVQVWFSYEKVRFFQVCTVGSDNLVLAPVMPRPPAEEAKDPKLEAMRAKVQALLREVAEHAGQPDEADCRARFREALHRLIDASPFTPEDRVRLKESVDAPRRKDAAPR